MFIRFVAEQSLLKIRFLTSPLSLLLCLVVSRSAITNRFGICGVCYLLLLQSFNSVYAEVCFRRMANRDLGL